MNISIQDISKYGYVISISKERYNNFINIFDKSNLPIPQLFKGNEFRIGKHPGAEINNKAFNCSLTHYMIVKMASVLNFPYVFIFEDDAVPLKESQYILQSYLIGIPQDFNMLILGHTKMKNQNIKEFSNRYVQYDAFGAHAYIVFNSFYEDYIRIFSDLMSSDENVFGVNNVFHTKENIFIQYNTTDDMLHSKKDELFNIQNDIDIANYCK